MQVKLSLHASLGTPLSLAVIAAFVIVAFAGPSDIAIAAKQPKCGDTITTDVTLHHNLANCPNNGIVIGADNITLDLNYHTIDGDGTPAAGCDPRTEFCDVGVANFGYDGVTVIHGSLRQFAGGVDFGKVRHNRLLDISASQNKGIGIQVFGSSRSVIRNSTGTGTSVRHEGTGLGLFDCHHVRVLHNSLRQNGEDGIHVADSAHNLIKGNRLSRNGAFGIILESSNRNQVRRNRSVRDGTIGIYVAPGSRNVIARNRISRTRGGQGEGVGLEVDGGDHNVFARNFVRDTEGNGISVGFDVVVGNVVRGNRIRRAGEDGLHVDNKAKHTHVRRNHAFGTKDDGLDANNSTTKLTRNEARRNADLGIEAVAGVIDGGGNRASGNGDPRQCTHIVCH